MHDRYHVVEGAGEVKIKKKKYWIARFFKLILLKFCRFLALILIDIAKWAK